MPQNGILQNIKGQVRLTLKTALTNFYMKIQNNPVRLIKYKLYLIEVKYKPIIIL